MTWAPPPSVAALVAAPVAHRGLHDPKAGRVENSRAAVAAAVSAGYGVEIDVQLSADGEAMVFHDETLDRLTRETGLLRERTAAALSDTALTGGGETIPTLGEILALVGGRAPLVVEIKDQGGTLDGAGVGPLEARVAALLSGHGGTVSVMSFNPASVAAMARLAPSLSRGVVACAAADYPDDIPAERREALAEMTEAEAVGAAFFSYDWRALPTPRTRALRAQGLAALCWTVRSAADAELALRGADALTFEGFAPELRADRPSPRV
ncbi:glycerophosphodiester phosphodiesterase family protein [Rubrimonas cliftonensis]|uniref:Glycerophosphoryl diester phosphodiesterase n=1 Tax=Rubrimonas cliftonensis TaxID=89524 RepID=A0A1H3YCJ9_9RHOB|nr:glycerophosphodiester phosphodiesterase family protein [Rubrimonas cliftonensis]SEA09335.1 Glycerophosphoryl diester phosphodiesterase [Rubrimonas cliftonensis]